MSGTELKSTYDRLYFELITDIAFLTNDLSEAIKSSIIEVNLKIFKLDENISSFEINLGRNSEEEQKKWSSEVDELKNKRVILISKIQKELKIQTQSIHSWISDLENLMENSTLTKI